MRLPTKEEFEALRLVLWNAFEILLMVLGMVGVVMVTLKHIPWGAESRCLGRSRGRNPAQELLQASDLAGLVETAHLLRSPRNARRLLTALRRVDAR